MSGDAFTLLGIIDNNHHALYSRSIFSLVNWGGVYFREGFIIFFLFFFLRGVPFLLGKSVHGGSVVVLFLFFIFFFFGYNIFFNQR